MRVNQCVGCESFPCTGVKHDRYILPAIEVKPEKVRLIVVSEAAPEDPNDYYYAGVAGGDDQPHFVKTTVQAFKQAGLEVSTLDDLIDLGVYFTTAVKCGKTGYGIKAATIKACSHISTQ